MTLPASLSSAFYRWVRRHRSNPLLRLGMRFARNYCEAYEHPGYDIAENGEAALLGALRSTGIRCCWDVGANIGDWSAAALQHLPGARVEAFEPVPETCARLRSRFGEPRLRVHPFGLGQAAGATRLVYFGPDHSFLSSAVHRTHVVSGTEISVEIKTGRECWSLLEDLPHLDLLKLDVEGMEYETLLGFGELLSPEHIKIIQFEHHGGYRPLKDFYTLLEARGYSIAKVFRQGVDFAPYDRWRERYAGPNYVALSATDSALKAHLSRF